MGLGLKDNGLGLLVCIVDLPFLILRAREL